MESKYLRNKNELENPQNPPFQNFGLRFFDRRKQRQEYPANSAERKVQEELHNLSLDLKEIECGSEKEEMEKILKEIESTEQNFIVFRTIAERSRKETSFMDELVETGVYEILIDANQTTNTLDGKPIQWEADIDSSGQCQNSYKIFIAKKPPEFSEILRELVEKTQLPQSIRTLQHEVVHTKQVNIEKFKKIAKAKILNKLTFQNNKNAEYEISRELREAHAYRVADNPVDETNAIELERHIFEAEKKNSEKVYTVNAKKLEFAVQAIDSLQALGLSIDEIGKLVDCTEPWDEKTCSYPEISKFIHDELEKRGLQTLDIFRLKELYRKKRLIARVKTKIIAYQELKIWKAKKDAESLAEAV